LVLLNKVFARKNYGEGRRASGEERRGEERRGEERRGMVLVMAMVVEVGWRLELVAGLVMEGVIGRSLKFDLQPL
jgi:hypothetical protein